MGPCGHEVMTEGAQVTSRRAGAGRRRLHCSVPHPDGPGGSCRVWTGDAVDAALAEHGWVAWWDDDGRVRMVVVSAKAAASYVGEVLPETELMRDHRPDVWKEASARSGNFGRNPLGERGHATAGACARIPTTPGVRSRRAACR